MKPAFVCEYCGEVGSEEFIKKHEEECLYNPDNHTCYSCAHYCLVNKSKYNPRCRKEISVHTHLPGYSTNCELWHKAYDLQERAYDWEER